MRILIAGRDAGILGARITRAALIIALGGALTVATPADGRQGSSGVRSTISGIQFTAENPRLLTAVENRGNSRLFRGRTRALVYLRARIPPPNQDLGEPALRRLALRFRTSPNGPSIRSVVLLAGSATVFRLEGLYLAGDFSGRDAPANTWTIDPPITIRGWLDLRIGVQYPVGFDSPIDPGELLIVSALADFPRSVRSTRLQP